MNSKSARSEEARGWRVGHQGRDGMYYEELRDGAWERLEIQGEMLMGPAHHVIYFASAAKWAQYPAWAAGRRDEIIARVTSEFREPDYEYYGLGAAIATPSTSPPEPASSPPESASPPAEPSAPAPRATAGRPNRRWPPGDAGRALLLVVLLLFLLAICMGWFVWHGISQGETWLPVKFSSANRHVTRAGHTSVFWGAIAVYAGLGVGALVLGALGVREGRRGKD